MLNVFFTVDVEIWPGSWERLDDRFAEHFRRYVYGPTAKGEYALPAKLQILNDHGLKGSFFVESLFASRVGIAPLQEIVGLIQDAGQEVQMHLHTEWVDKLPTPLLANRSGQHMRCFSKDEQKILIARGLENLSAAGRKNIVAFRAGNYGFNADTLEALAAHNLTFDASYNPCFMGTTSGIAPGQILYQPVKSHGVYEYPVSVYEDYPGHLRHAQLGAVSYAEMTTMLRRAMSNNWHCFVMVSHNFELLDRTKSRPDRIAVRRFRKLCRFLDRHRDEIHASGFDEHRPQAFDRQPEMIRSNPLRTGWRIAEQLSRRIFY